MAEYINKEAIRNELYSADVITMRGVYMLNNFPAADVEEVKHGRWIEQTAPRWKTWYCSECKTLGSPHWKRCPVCEAKMNGGKENEIE